VQKFVVVVVNLGGKKAQVAPVLVLSVHHYGVVVV
jgi:hypothetical protein